MAMHRGGPIDLKELEALARAATPGPWKSWIEGRDHTQAMTLWAPKARTSTPVSSWRAQTNGIRTATPIKISSPP